MSYSEHGSVANSHFAQVNPHLAESILMDVIKFVYRKPIRDLAFHLEHNDLILTVSLDKTVKLVNMAIKYDIFVRCAPCGVALGMPVINVSFSLERTPARS